MTSTAAAAPTMEPASAPLPSASIRVAMQRFFDRSFRMRGRASRSEYWWWMLVNLAVVTALVVITPLLIAGRPMVTELTVGPFGSLVYPTLTIASWSGATAATSPALVFLSFIAGGWVLLTAIPGIAIAVGASTTQTSREGGPSSRSSHSERSSCWGSPCADRALRDCASTSAASESPPRHRRRGFRSAAAGSSLARG